jgi:hypothetical protein
MDSQDRYYKKKLEQLQAEEHRKSDEKTLKQIVPLVIGGIILLAIYFVLLFLVAPGVLIQTLLTDHMNIKVGFILMWVYAAAISAAFAAATFYAAKNAKLTARIYIVICAAAAATSAAIPSHGNSTIFEYALLQYSPLNGFIELSGPSKTSSESPKIVPPTEPQNTVALTLAENAAQTTTDTTTNKQLTAEEKDKNQATPEEYKTPENQEGYQPNGPSFSCKRATLKAEKIICESPNLSKLDLQLSSTYQKKLDQTDDKKPLKAEQLEWILKSMRPCEDEECLSAAYTQRIRELSE